MVEQTDLTARLATCPAECWTFQGYDTSACRLTAGHEGDHETNWPSSTFDQTEADEVAEWQRKQT